MTKPEGEIRVIVAGLGRTGTMSMQEALRTLGYKTYHMEALMRDGSHAKKWRELSEGKVSVNEVFEKIAKDGYNATMDNPMCEYFAEQSKMFPDAKVILTLHPKEAAGWEKSFSTLMEFVRVQSSPFSLFYPNFLSLIPSIQDLNAARCLMGQKTMWLEPCELTYGYDQHREGWLATQYEKHNAMVRTLVPEEKLLEFTVTEGWEPLCSFLELPVPDVPFPKVNDSAFIARLGLILKVVIYSWIPVTVLLLMCLRRCCRSSKPKPQSREKAD